VAENESVDQICERIRADGQKEIDSILEKARAAAAEIIAKAEEEAKHAGERIVKEAADKGEILKKRSLSSVSLEVKRIRLRAREEVVTAVMEQAKGKIDGSRSRPDYPDILAGLIVEALGYLEGGEFVVYADKRDLGLLSSKTFPAVLKMERGKGRQVTKLEAKELPGPTSGGVRIAVPGASVIYDNIFEARLYRYRDAIRRLIFGGLFSAKDKIE
jgi:vacuolar-type H+-ATPase subunit E/Vma4